MAKWADYLISGVWFQPGTQIISHVNVHTDSDDGLGSGMKKTEVDVIRLLKSNKTVKTIVWNYEKGSFNMGEDVGFIQKNGREYLRTHRNKTVTDNLDNMLNMDWIL